MSLDVFWAGGLIISINVVVTELQCMCKDPGVSQFEVTP